MARVILDKLDGSRASIDGVGLKELDRIIIVGELTGDSWTDKILEACTAAGLDYGDVYPGNSGNAPLYLETIEGTSIEDRPDAIELSCRYVRSLGNAVFENDAIEFEASVSSQEITKNNEHTDVYLEYTYALDDPFNPTKDDVDESGNSAKIAYVDRVPALRQIQVPQISWTVSKKQNMSKSQIKTHIKTYVGRVNSDIWDGNDARTVLCAGIRARSSDGGDTFDCTYNYQYKENTWDNTARYTKSLSGKPVSDEELAVGTNSTAEVTSRDYPEVSFSALPTGE